VFAIERTRASPQRRLVDVTSAARIDSLRRLLSASFASRHEAAHWVSASFSRCLRTPGACWASPSPNRRRLAAS